VVAPYELIVLALTGRSPFNTHSSVQTALILTLIESLVVGGLISALYVHALKMIAEGGAPAMGEVAVRGLRVLPTVIAAQIIATIGIGLGLILIIPGVILAIRWAVVAQAAAVESENWVEALKRSAELTAGNYLHVLGVLLIVGLLAVLLTDAAILVVGTHKTVAAISVGIVVETLARSFVALSTAVLFFDLLARKRVAHV
jgi:hypothetical protein